MTRLVGVVKGPTIAAAKEQMARAEPYADLLEIRLDLLEPKALQRLADLPREKPIILTFRKKSQGGARDLQESERQEILEKCLKIEPEYCDIETDTDFSFFDRVLEKFPKIKIIGSFHDFNGMPENLEEMLEKMHRPHINFYKIAVTVGKTTDALDLMAFAREKKNLTCIAMGMDGQVSRILSPMIHGEFCYASIEEGDSPLGQLSLKTLCEIYRFKKIKPDWKIYALLGDPVEKSIGHLFHNSSFPEGAIYVKLHMPIPDMPYFFSVMRKFPFGGFSITMPLKEQLERFLTKIDPASAKIGSVNTIKVEDEHLIGFNTDGLGAINSLEKHGKVKGKKIAILGAGGSARSIAYEALARGAHVTVLNRTIERAEAMAKEFECSFGALEDFTKTSYDILINTVPVDLIYVSESIHPSTIVMDIVYWEDETPLLRAAKQRGCICINGHEMFEEQAKLQQKIWFGDLH